jgi:hypothetical protein
MTASRGGEIRRVQNTGEATDHEFSQRSGQQLVMSADTPKRPEAPPPPPPPSAGKQQPN